MSELIDRLAAELDPPVERRETHTAWVLLSGDRALKVRKPVRMAFVDYSTPERRLHALRAEVTANAELAPGLYLGVRSLCERDDGRIEVVEGERENAVEHAVELRRYDERDTMAARLSAGRLAEGDVDAVARRIAAFHAGAPTCPGGGADRFEARVRADLDDLEEPESGPLRRYAVAALRRRAAELDDRAARGLRRDGHGDLRAEHVLLVDPLMIVDRLEFDRTMRCGDVAGDLAFLTMDLEALGAPWAAQRLIAAYAEAGGDAASPGLQALLAWQRVLVRIKVARLRGDVSALVALADLGANFAWRERLPPVVLVAGAPASGKSTLAAALARATGRPVIATDPVRKAMHGVPATEALPPEAYDEEATLEVYREVGRRAARSERGSGGVIIDATARSPLLRRALLDGLGGQATPAVIVCVAPPEILRARAQRRLADPARVSDAGPAVALRLAEAYEPPVMGEPGLGPVVRVHTAAGDALAEAARTLDAATG